MTAWTAWAQTCQRHYWLVAKRYDQKNTVVGLHGSADRLGESERLANRITGLRGLDTMHSPKLVRTLGWTALLHTGQNCTVHFSARISAKCRFCKHVWARRGKRSARYAHDWLCAGHVEAVAWQVSPNRSPCLWHTSLLVDPPVL